MLDTRVKRRTGTEQTIDSTIYSILVTEQDNETQVELIRVEQTITLAGRRTRRGEVST